MRDVQTHERERDDYSDGKERKTERTGRKRKKGGAGIWERGRNKERRERERERERGEGESNVSECTAMERL